MKAKNTKKKTNSTVASKAKHPAVKPSVKPSARVAEEMCSKMMCEVSDLCSMSHWKTKWVLILKIVVAYLVIYQVFLHGGNTSGIMALGGIVTFLVNWRMEHDKKDKKHACSSFCLKSSAISLVVGAVVTWVLSVVGDLFFGEAGANLGIIIGILLAIDVAQHFIHKFVHTK